MNEVAIKKSLKELREMLANLGSSSGQRPAGSGLYVSDVDHDESSIAECLDQLRLGTKYLIFDLEATRRENHFLRQMLDVHRRGKREKQDDNGLHDW